MRFLLLLLVALSLTLAWQSSVVASMSAEPGTSCVELAKDGGETGRKQMDANATECE